MDTSTIGKAGGDLEEFILGKSILGNARRKRKPWWRLVILTGKRYDLAKETTMDQQKKAFARPGKKVTLAGDVLDGHAQEGMTLLEYYVGQALGSLSPHIIGSKYPESASKEIADWAIKIATATMEKLDDRC